MVSDPSDVDAGGACPDCGARLEPGDAVCRDCGLVLDAAPKGGALTVLANRSAWLLGAVYLLAAAGLATGDPPATASGAAFALGGGFLCRPRGARSRRRPAWSSRGGRSCSSRSPRSSSPGACCPSSRR